MMQRREAISHSLTDESFPDERIYYKNNNEWIHSITINDRHMLQKNHFYSNLFKWMRTITTNNVMEVLKYFATARECYGANNSSIVSLGNCCNTFVRYSVPQFDWSIARSRRIVLAVKRISVKNINFNYISITSIPEKQQHYKRVYWL